MRILLAIDGSPSSEAAVDEVCRRPWPAGSKVLLMTVLSPVDIDSIHDVRATLSQPIDHDNLFDHPRLEKVKFMEDAATALEQRAPDLSVTPMLLEGRPKDVILDEADTWCAELIIVGSHGYGVVRKFMLGSVSFAVALNAKCSVEIVRRLPEHQNNPGQFGQS